jgi:hypothetical protein
MPHSKGYGRHRERRSKDPVGLGAVVDGLLAQDVFSRGMPIAKLMASWPQLVGERLAQATQPASLEGGLLVIRASDGPWGAQAMFLADEIRKRADEALGGGVVKRVRIVVGRAPSDH